ncbi:MAG TPA: ABC transporter permease [Xanthobacteraceae bacterium]|jgi:NitT/TauT family transport system permease protein|nr:ABC transporter permease [Xanthobacteraceae bacterium]
MMQNKWLGRAMPYLTVLTMLVVWELICIVFAIPSFVLPRPSVVAVSLYQNFNTIWFHAERTLVTTLLGFGLAVIVGVVLGIVVGSSQLVYQGLYPVLVGFNSVPKVALVPLMVVWFGIGTVPAVLTAFMLSFFPIAVNIATGIATLEPELQDVLRSLGASRLDIISRVGLPRSLPYFFASLKISITLAFVGSVISETLASDRGIGTLVEQASANFKIPLVFAGLVVVATLGIAMYAIFAYIEKRMTHWATRTVEFGIGG